MGTKSRDRLLSNVLKASSGPVNLFLIMRIHLALVGLGLDGSNGMSGHEVQADANLLSAFAMMIGGALGVALPMTIVIIWICS